MWLKTFDLIWNPGDIDRSEDLQISCDDGWVLFRQMKDQSAVGWWAPQVTTIPDIADKPEGLWATLLCALTALTADEWQGHTLDRLQTDRCRVREMEALKQAGAWHTTLPVFRITIPLPSCLTSPQWRPRPTEAIERAVTHSLMPVYRDKRKLVWLVHYILFFP